MFVIVVLHILLGSVSDLSQACSDTSKSVYAVRPLIVQEGLSPFTSHFRGLLPFVVAKKKLMPSMFVGDVHANSITVSLLGVT